MRTTLDLPKELLSEALAISGIKTKTAVITTALEDFVRKNKIAELKTFRGAVDIDLSLDSLRDRK